MSAAATVLPPAARGLSVEAVDETIRVANILGSHQLVREYVASLQARIAQLEAAATEYLEATVALDLHETEAGQLNRNLAAERKLREVLP